MQTSVSLSPLGINHANPLLEFSKSTFLATYAAHNTPENMALYVAKNFTIEQVQWELQQPNNWFFVVKKQEEWLGYMKLVNSENPPELGQQKALEIERIYVIEQAKGLGIGTQLINHATQVAQSQGFNILWLGVWEFNSAAIAFYEKMGFQRFGQHVFQLGSDAQTDFLMKIDIFHL